MYGKIRESRLLDIEVYEGDNLLYKGKIEDAPEEIRQLKYSKVNISNDIVCEVYSQAQNN